MHRIVNQVRAQQEDTMLDNNLYGQVQTAMLTEVNRIIHEEMAQSNEIAVVQQPQAQHTLHRLIANLRQRRSTLTPDTVGFNEEPRPAVEC
jgi:hypothetical protein